MLNDDIGEPLSLRPLAFTCRNFIHKGQREEVTAIICPNKVLPAKGGGSLITWRCSLEAACEDKRCVYRREREGLSPDLSATPFFQ